MIRHNIVYLVIGIFLATSLISAAVFSQDVINSDQNQLVQEQTNFTNLQTQIQTQTNNSTIIANIDIDPDTLNLRSNGKWITCYIELPEGYNVSDINASTILLNGNLTPILDMKFGFVKDPNGYIVDHDGDNISERMLKFDRARVQQLLVPGLNVNVTITGKLYNNISFAGTDTIRVINPPNEKIKKYKPKDNETKPEDDVDDNDTGEPDTNNNGTDDQQNSNSTNNQNGTNNSNSTNNSNGTNDQDQNNNSSSNISAQIKIMPASINLKSEGNWITCIIELPSGYNVTTINASSVRLNGNLSPILDPKYGFVTNQSEYLTDEDGDGNYERMFKFDRAEVQELLSDVDNKETVEIFITGLVNNIFFQGSDTVKVINK
jgi:hypothetical protein